MEDLGLERGSVLSVTRDDCGEGSFYPGPKGCLRCVDILGKL